MSDPVHEFVSLSLRRAVMECLSVASAGRAGDPDAEALFHAPETLRLKREILDVGRKLWQRQYVDGNGGNISIRVSPRYALCTPTLLGKGDLREEDLVLVDLHNRRICGERRQTSEILLHLEIYKAVPEARAVIHAHPAYATAFAVAGIVPQPNLIPEQEVFIGPVVVSPYDTPGTQAFAETILPFVKNHNTILLQNHGVVCWADTATHAEWLIEVIDTYCKTFMLARQLRSRLDEIPPEKMIGLLEMKARHGLPDARFNHPPAPGGAAMKAPAMPLPDDLATPAEAARPLPTAAQLNTLVDALTEQVLHALNG